MLLRLFHPWWDWECYGAGFFKTTPPNGMDSERAKSAYRDFFRIPGAFEEAMPRVVREWPRSCEQFLTHPSLNRIAWLGQASACITVGIPRHFRAGFYLLDDGEQEFANELARKFIEGWDRGMDSLADKVREYIRKWKRQGYIDGVPDEVPEELMHDNMAPSYKAIALALLKNDNNLESLGFTPRESPWYSAIKRVELADRARAKEREPVVRKRLFERLAQK